MEADQEGSTSLTEAVLEIARIRSANNKRDTYTVHQDKHQKRATGARTHRSQAQEKDGCQELWKRKNTSYVALWRRMRLKDAEGQE